jgi:hypothetical protein
MISEAFVTQNCGYINFSRSGSYGIFKTFPVFTNSNEDNGFCIINAAVCSSMRMCLMWEYDH